MPASPPAPALEESRLSAILVPPIARTSIIVTEQDRIAAVTWDLEPTTDDTASAQTMGEVVAEMLFMMGSHMPAELLRQTAPNHPFATQAARYAFF